MTYVTTFETKNILRESTFNDHLQIGVFSCSYFMQGERSVPRASDIWRNKVKDFLAARYYLTHIGDFTHISDICDIHDISVNYDVNLPTKKNEPKQVNF